MDILSNTICRSCRIRLATTNAARAFSTSSSRQIIPPESPTFVEVPRSYQEDLNYQKRAKGSLPQPRELFPPQRPDKPSKEYLDNLTKSPLPHNEKSYESLSELGKYRYRMAQLRKKHIREGLTELHQRKLDTISKMETRSSRRQTERARLLSQAPREDARLTNNSVPRAMQLAKSATPIADDLAITKAMYEQKLANFNAHNAAKEEERLDALHTLYMNAREFITTEKQLQHAIAEQFDSDTVFLSAYSNGKSMWNRGPPDTIKQMISNNRVQNTSSAAQMLNSTINKTDPTVKMRFDRDQARMKKIAEKLSGGKI